MDNRLDLINEEDLKRIQFKAYDERDPLWELKELRGMLGDSAMEYSVINQVCRMIEGVADNLHYNTNYANKLLLKDIVFIIDFLNGDN
jgi:hypothetical protein